MKRTILFAAIFTTTLFSGSLFAQKITLDKNVTSAIQTASADDIKADITYLADDKLLGRQPGKEGYQMAVDYVIKHLKDYGVQPFGENSTWLQQVKLRRAYYNKGGVMVISSGSKSDTLRYGPDAFIQPNPENPSVKMTAPLVFAGYGISDKAENYDDYTGIDAKGKIVMVFRGAPKSFPSSVAAHSQDLLTIEKNALAHGAIGVMVANADSTGRGMINPPKGTYTAIDEKGKIVVSRNYTGGIGMAGSISYRITQKILTARGKDIARVIEALKNGQAQSTAVSFTLSAAANFAYQDIISYNVVGKITGSDPKLKEEYVVHSAHLDHLGVGTPVQGDSIYNGAHDNASGVASLLQIAKIYSQVDHKPKRSVIILMVTAEEMGELGSGYFAAHPLIPAHKMVADVNTDMPTIIAPLLSVTALGAEHSSLSGVVDKASAYFDLSVEPDPEPAQNRFVRSDQYSFVKQGIPALHIKYGSKTPDGKNNLNEFVEKWRAKYYHKPQDDINGVFDFEAGRKYAQLNFLIGYLVANDPVRPTWNKGDIFAK